MARIICLDFDGVIHSYDSGWQGVDVIPDDPVPGAFEFIDALFEAGMEPQIYSSRSKAFDGRAAMKEWFCRHGREDLAEKLKFPDQKPPAFLTIDDRAIVFTGRWPKIEEVQGFVPWNKR